MSYFRTLALIYLYFLIVNLGSCSKKIKEVNVLNQPENFTLSIHDYKRAERFLPQNMLPLMHEDIRTVYWQEVINSSEDMLVVRRITDTQSAYELINPVTKKVEKLFDTQKLKLQLDGLLKQESIVKDLVLSEVVLNSTGDFITFFYQDEHFRFDLSGQTAPMLLEKNQFEEVISPDGTKAVYIKDNNLWLRRVTSGDVLQLTFGPEIIFR